MSAIEPFSITHDVGIGDFFNAESFWSPARKAALTTVHHAFGRCAGSNALREAMRACPAYRHVEHTILRYPTEKVPGSFPTLRDHAISHRLTFHGSAFLQARLDVEVPGNLPDRFVYIQPSTPKNGPGCTRFVTDGEWPFILERLQDLDQVGLVCNMPGGKSTIPSHPRILDRTGQTSFPQAIEILKRAEGYIGVDSNFAILAAQLFPASKLWVRCNNPYLVDQPWLTYPPLTDYSFLVPRFGQAPHKIRRNIPERAGLQIVELRCNALVNDRTYGGGGRVEVEPDRAGRMLSAGQAVAVEDLDAVQSPTTDHRPSDTNRIDRP